MRQMARIRFALVGATMALAVLTTLLVQQPEVQTGLGVLALATGIILAALGTRREALAATCGCGAVEDWGLGFCHRCGRKQRAGE